MMKKLLVLTAAAVAAFAFPQVELSGAILKDHVSDSKLYDGQGILVQGFPTSLNRTVLAGAAATFTGDGNLIKTIGGVFATEGSDGSQNGGAIESYQFRVTFFDSVETYLADPFGENLDAPSSLHTLGSPSNSDWLIPRGNSDQGHNLMYWEFNVESLRIRTNAGETQLAMIQPVGFLDSGIAFMAFSTGGGNATGELSDFNRSDINDIGPATLSELNAPTPFAAYYIETAVPEPNTALLAFYLFAYACEARCIKRRH